MSLTAENRTNLKKLASYLEALPEDYEHFDMSVYLADNGDDGAVEHYARHNGGVASCGSVACAVGHGPAAGVFVPAHYLRSPYVRWGGYAREAFGARHSNGVFSWLFSEDWRPIDNTPHGAAARIRYMLDEGCAPRDWDFDKETVALYAPYRATPSNGEM